MFKSVHKFPELVAWLEDGENRPSDLKAWGFKASVYDFAALRRYLTEHNEKVVDKKKKKGRSKAQESSDESVEVPKGKEKGKDKDKGKKKSKSHK